MTWAWIRFYTYHVLPITTHKPDPCGLQEAKNHCQHFNSIEHTEYLAKQTATRGYFERFMHFQNNEYCMTTLKAELPHASKQLH